MSKLSAFHNEEGGVPLYPVDCVSFMEEISRKHPSGVFVMIFADPLYFLSNGSTTYLCGKEAKSRQKEMGQANLLSGVCRATTGFVIQAILLQMFQRTPVLYVFEGTRY